ncbi:NAD dependent epimerase/dehydratase family protein [Diplocarpon rosae]|nr:NAD dependent epimerase/dehydratase family protein [Diplocarpon rosae]
MPNARILLLGGHGKVSLLLTPKLIQRSWDVVSVIRNPEQKTAILEAGKNGPGKIEVLIESLGDVKSEGDAKKILEKARPDWVIWSAGAGGKGGKEATYAIDRDACIHFIRSSLSTPSISKFLLVSALSIRRERASWWDETSWAIVRKINEEIMPDYYKAKLAADEVITVLGEEKKGFGYVVLRPGALSDDPEDGKVVIGKTPAKGQVSRGDVAEVAARLLEKEGVSGWFDMLGGGGEIGNEIERVLGGKVDSREGESLEVMRKNLQL